MLVTGIGQCSLDHLAVVDSYPLPDTKKEVSVIVEQGGGPVATALVTLSRLGIPSRFHGIAGDDLAGDKIRASLAREGINTDGLLRRDGAASQVAFIIIEEWSARRTIFWKRPSAEPVRPVELGDGFLSGTSFLLLDGLMTEASLFAAQKARQEKIPVMLDAGRVRPGMLEVARLSDYVVASEEFARDLGWTAEPGALLKGRHELGADVLTVTLGNRGSMTAAGESTFRTPAFDVKAVDTTGAGDVFHGAYIYGLLRGWDLTFTVTFASAVAAMKCTRIGGRQGIPRLDEVLDFLHERGMAIEQK